MDLPVVYSRFSSLSLPQGEGSCLHHPAFILSEVNEVHTFCGLCWLIKGFAEEVPGRFHAYKQLAENGNPECSPRFLKHLELAMGLKPPKKRQSLKHFRLTRERYSHASYGSFPVSSALWDMMGTQPPLAEPLFYKLAGLSDIDIAVKMGISLYNLHVRLRKATRLALRFVRHDSTLAPKEARTRHNHSTGGDDRTNPEQASGSRRGAQGPRSQTN